MQLIAVRNLFTRHRVKLNNGADTRKLDLCDPDLTRFYDHRRIPYGNVIFYKGMEDDRMVVMNHATESGVISCGRFGEWDYLWSNQSLLSGYQACFNNQ